jgi:hypothetical protein
LRLVDEASLNQKFFIAFGHPPGSFWMSEPKDELRVQIPAWTRREMRRAFDERFQPNKVENSFFDFAWNTGQATHSRETFAQMVLRVVANTWLLTDRAGTWCTEPHCEKNDALVQEFQRDLYEPIVQIKTRLDSEDIPKGNVRKLLDFLDAAALCHPTILVITLLSIAGVTEEQKDGFIDCLDDLFGVGEAEACCRI